MEDNPFMTVNVSLKGFPVMHDTKLLQAQVEGYLPQIQPRSPSLAQQLVHLLQEVLALSPSRHDLQAPSPRPRGRPPVLSLPHLYLALLMGVLQQTPHLSTIWRHLYLEEIGTFAPVRLSYEAVRKRLLSAGTSVLQQLFETVSAALATLSPPPPSALELAPFASQVVALDESTLDHLRRLTADLRELPNGDPHLLPGKLAGLFDLRRQRWMRVQFRADVLAHCTTGILLLLEGLPPGSLILADLGYFSFPWFDYLTEQGYWWVSRLKEGVSYEIKEVLAYDDQTGLLDAIVWLGKYRADRAAHAARLVSFRFHGTQYRYLTNVLRPSHLSLHDIVGLYARRWDIELDFKLLKCELGLHLWWGARPELVLIQLWIALILAQLLHTLQRQVALQADVDPFDVSMHLLVELLAIIPAGPTPIIDRLVQDGRALGLIRPASRHQVVVPPIEPHMLCPPPEFKDLVRHARYAQRNPHPRSAPFTSRFSTQLLI
jgi:Transposase DDE domain